jgi:excisionase family DNA binding protein
LADPETARDHTASRRINPPAHILRQDECQTPERSPDQKLKLTQFHNGEIAMEGAVGENLWNKDDVAAYLNVSPSWVYQKVAAGLLPHVRIGGLVRFHPELIRKFAAGERP